MLVYALLAVAGSWVYPLLTVHLPHRGYGETPDPFFRRAGVPLRRVP